MKIAIDTRLSNNPKSGMGVYVTEIFKRLKEINHDEYINLNYLLGKRNFFQKVCDLIYEQFWIQVKVVYELNNRKAQILYSPNPPTSFLTKVPVVLTIPDMSFYFDSSLNPIIKIYLYWVYYLSAKKAKIITTFSQNSKQDINKLLKINPDKIEIITPAIKDIFRRSYNKNDIAKVLNKLNIKGLYFLSVPGTFIKRKNPQLLIDGFNNLPQKIKNDFKLVFVGNNHDYSYKLFEDLVKGLNLEQNVLVTGYVTDEELACLYQGAYLFVMTSLYEGFGLPPVEAMASKTPVIVFENSSLPEIIGDAGMKVKTSDELTKAISSLVNSQKLRDNLIKLGTEQVKLYDWDKSARRTNNLLKKAANES